VIIPASQFLTGDAKRIEKEKYCQHLSKIPCKNFDSGNGKCPFGSSCLYLHKSDIPMAPETYTVIKGADGSRTKKATQLSDFLKS
jgi:E3 ubiquitin-protein ligase makorin